MEKVCYLCKKELKDEDSYQFFPEDDTYICKACLSKDTSKE